MHTYIYLLANIRPVVSTNHINLLVLRGNTEVYHFCSKHTEVAGCISPCLAMNPLVFYFKKSQEVCINIYYFVVYVYLKKFLLTHKVEDLSGEFDFEEIHEIVKPLSRFVF
jgi:hypothetical protein